MTAVPRPLIAMAEAREALCVLACTCAECKRLSAEARLFRAADAVIENAGPMAWLLVAEADEQYRAALRSAIAAYRAAEKEVQKHEHGE